MLSKTHDLCPIEVIIMRKRQINNYTNIQVDTKTCYTADVEDQNTVRHINGKPDWPGTRCLKDG